MTVKAAKLLVLPCIRIFCLIVGLSACSSLPERVKLPALAGEQEALYDIAGWLLDGRIAIKINGESWQASLTWDHTRIQDKLRLSGPLGVGAVDIYMSGHFMRLVHSDGEVETSYNSDSLLKERLGFPVPLKDLQYWVLGLPSLESSKHQVVETYESGRTKTMIQSGWRIIYKDFRQVGQWVLPKKIIAVRDTARLVLVADDWVL